jgi:hypothetical protein
LDPKRKSWSSERVLSPKSQELLKKLLILNSLIQAANLDTVDSKLQLKRESSTDLRLQLKKLKLNDIEI